MDKFFNILYIVAAISLAYYVKKTTDRRIKEKIERDKKILNEAKPLAKRIIKNNIKKETLRNANKIGKNIKKVKKELANKYKDDIQTKEI